MILARPIAGPKRIKSGDASQVGDARETEKAPDAFRTISEVADELDLPQHVLRFWETRFTQIKPVKRGGGRRFYRPDDVDLLRGIRHLLYTDGYTIKGVQKILKEHGIRHVQDLGVEREAAEMRTAGRPRGGGSASDGTTFGGLLGLLPRRRARDREAEEAAFPPMPELPLPFPDPELDGEDERPATAPPLDLRREARPPQRSVPREEPRVAPSFAPEPQPRRHPDHPPPAPPQRRPSRGPAAQVEHPAPSPELDDPLLPFFDMEPPIPSSEPLDARIRHLQANAEEAAPARLHRDERALQSREDDQAARAPRRRRDALMPESDGTRRHQPDAQSGRGVPMVRPPEHAPSSGRQAITDPRGPEGRDPAAYAPIPTARRAPAPEPMEPFEDMEPDEPHLPWDEPPLHPAPRRPIPAAASRHREGGAHPIRPTDMEHARHPSESQQPPPAPASESRGIRTHMGSAEQEMVQPFEPRPVPPYAPHAARKPVPSRDDPDIVDWEEVSPERFRDADYDDASSPGRAAPAHRSHQGQHLDPRRGPHLARPHLGPLTAPPVEVEPEGREAPFAWEDDDHPYRSLARRDAERFGPSPEERAGGRAPSPAPSPAPWTRAPGATGWHGYDPLDAQEEDRHESMSRPPEPLRHGPPEQYLPPHLRSEPRVVGQAPSAAPVLSRADVHRLQATLYELSECRRLMVEALRPREAPASEE